MNCWGRPKRVGTCGSPPAAGTAQRTARTQSKALAGSPARHEHKALTYTQSGCTATKSRKTKASDGRWTCAEVHTLNSTRSHPPWGSTIARANRAQACPGRKACATAPHTGNINACIQGSGHSKCVGRRAAHADKRERGDRIPERARVCGRRAASAAAAGAAAARAGRRVRRGGGAGRAAAGATAVEREDMHGALVGRHRQPLGAAREGNGVNARRVRAAPQLLPGSNTPLVARVTADHL